MDCLDFRRRVSIEPRACDNTIAEHAERCIDCARFLRDLRQLDYQLERAIKVEMPECLPARIVMRQANQSKFKHIRRVSAMLAACILLTVIVTQQYFGGAMRALESNIRHYVENTVPTPLENTPLTTVNQLLERVGVRLDESIGEIIAAEPCSIDRLDGVHIIVTTDNGPVNVVVLPNHEINETRRFSTTGGQGLLAPCPRGGIAVIGKDAAIVDQMRVRVEQAMNFI